MATLILFDGPEWADLFPLTLTRPCAELRVGIFTIREKWAHYHTREIAYHCADYLRPKYPTTDQSDVLLVNGATIPDDRLWESISSLHIGESLYQQDRLIALRTDQYDATGDISTIAHQPKAIKQEIIRIEYPEHIFLINGDQIQSDFSQITVENKSAPIPDTVRLTGDPKNLLISPSAKVEHCYLNVTDGPIYIGPDAVILDGTMMRGPVAVGTGAAVKMGAKIYQGTTIGPRCKIGGEVKRSVFLANSNKGHDGYVGDSVIGEWCNFGADSNTSNMKNTYGLINLYHIASDQKRRTAEQFCGLMMGDHSRCAINTQFNTGTVCGIFANVYGPPPQTYIPSYSWGSDDIYDIEKAIEIAKIVHDRRKITFSEVDESILRYLYKQYSVS